MCAAPNTDTRGRNAARHMDCTHASNPARAVANAHLVRQKLVQCVAVVPQSNPGGGCHFGHVNLWLQINNIFAFRMDLRWLKCGLILNQGTNAAEATFCRAVQCLPAFCDSIKLPLDVARHCFTVSGASTKA